MKMNTLVLASIAALSTTGAFANDPAPKNEVVISVQKLVDGNHNGIKRLDRAAKKMGADLDWQSYETADFGLCSDMSMQDCLTIIPSRTVENKNPPTAAADFEIKEVVGRSTKKEWKNYITYKYDLVDTVTNEVVKSSPVLAERFIGGCKPSGMCFQTFPNDIPLGTSKAKALKELIEYAVKLKQ